MKLKGLIILISSLKSYSPKKERLPQPWNKANHKVELIPSWKGSGRAVCPAPVCIHSSVPAHQSPPKDAANPAKHISTRTGSCHLVTQRGITARSCPLHFKNLLKIVPVKQLTCGECHILQGTSFQAFPWNTRTSACGFRVNSEERRNDASPCSAATSGAPDGIFYFPFLPWPTQCSPGSIACSLRHEGVKKEGNHGQGHGFFPTVYQRHPCSKPRLSWDLISNDVGQTEQLLVQEATGR